MHPWLDWIFRLFIGLAEHILTANVPYYENWKNDKTVDGKGLQTYTFTNQCQEQESVSLDDSSKKIFYNASAYESGKKQALNDFLKFVCKNEACDELTTSLSGKISQIKREEKFRKEYMSMNIHECDIRREAKAEGRREGREEGLLQGKEESQKETAENLLKMNILSLEQISQATGLSVEKINDIKNSMEIK